MGSVEKQMSKLLVEHTISAGISTFSSVLVFSFGGVSASVFFTGRFDITVCTLLTSRDSTLTALTYLHEWRLCTDMFALIFIDILNVT
jgi:hypothetical protein